MVAEALRNYETLSLNALPEIPAGAKLIGTMAMAGAQPPQKGFIAKILIRIGAVAMSGAQPPQKGPIAERVIRFVNRFKAVADVAIGLNPSASIAWSAIQLLMSREREELSLSVILDILSLTVGNLGFRELDQRGRELRSQKRAFTQRILMAMFGGIALIGPMLIMTLLPGKNTALITVCITTFALGLALAFLARDSTGKDVLAATAAYAAVFVVFVGTSTSTQTTSG